MHKQKQFVAALLVGAALGGMAQAADSPAIQTDTAKPWMNTALSADQRADLVLAQMRFDEMHTLLHGIYAVKMPLLKDQVIPKDAVGSAGYVYGIPRLGIPALQETDASLGIANPMNVRPEDVATPLPSSLATAASFDPAVAYAGGAMIGREAHQKGFNVLLAGGVNLARDPRNGRNFEYLGEDPLLAGTLDGQSIRGIQDQHVISTAKHFAVNDQETNRHYADSQIGEAAMRESDLLAFEIAIETGHPGSVMCGYNLVNGAYDCGNDHLLNGILKGDWKYPGWVMSDWGAVHSLDYAMKGLDQQSAAKFDIKPFFEKPLAQAVKNGSIPESRVRDMAHRILREMFAVGVIDHPAKVTTVDTKAGGQVALQTAEEGIVLLKNKKGTLPLAKTAQKIAVIGGYSGSGVLSGGGSAQVIPKGSLKISLGGEGFAAWMNTEVFHPSSPLGFIRKAAPKAEVRYEEGHYTSKAVKLAKWADVVIIFGNQWLSEGMDAADMKLPDRQNALISAVTKANPHAIVVLQTGNPVLMPWLDQAAAVLEAWYPGARGGEAIANVLFGDVNPSGHLPLTFPASVSQLPRQKIPGTDVHYNYFDRDYSLSKAIPVKYTEGANVGYRWYASQGLTPLYPFGYGLSYTHFSYDHLRARGGKTLTVSFDVTNAGKVAGAAVPQLYLTHKAGEKCLRLIGFQRVNLKPGESRHITLSADPRLLADFDVAENGWKIAAGDYVVSLNRSATDAVQAVSAPLTAEFLKP